MSILLINCTALPFLHAVKSFTEQAPQLLILPNVHYLLSELSNKTLLSDIVSIIIFVGGATTILLHIKYLTILPYLFNISQCAMISSQRMCSQLKKVWITSSITTSSKMPKNITTINKLEENPHLIAVLLFCYSFLLPCFRVLPSFWFCSKICCKILCKEQPQFMIHRSVMCWNDSKLQSSNSVRISRATTLLVSVLFSEVYGNSTFTPWYPLQWLLHLGTAYTDSFPIHVYYIIYVLTKLKWVNAGRRYTSEGKRRPR